MAKPTIPREAHGHLFEPFYNLNTIRDIGLDIMRPLGGHGDEVSVERPASR